MIKKVLLISTLFTLGGAAIFIFGNPYIRVFPTNWSLDYYLGMTVVFLILAFIFKRKKQFAKFYTPSYALFVASAALLFLKIGIFNIHTNSQNALKGIAVDKLSQFFHVVPVIVLLTLIGGDSLKSIFIKRSNLRYGISFGLISFAGFAILATLLQTVPQDVFTRLTKNLPWLLIFIFANSIMEELWFRGLFLKKYEPVIGRRAAIIVTALVFGTSHVFATYEFPGGEFIFGMVVFILGLVGAQAMFKEDGLIGPVLFHAGYDLMIILPVLYS